MLEWQKSTAPDRAEVERNAERVGITRSEVADYFNRVETEWANRDECITFNCDDKAQFLRDAANWLAEQIEAIRCMSRTMRSFYKPVLETPNEHGDYFIEVVD